MKINLGAGNKHTLNYKSVDLYKEKQKEYLKKNKIDFYSGDAMEYLISLESNSIDEVYSRHFFEHLSLKEINNYLSQIQRILVENGKITIIVPHYRNPYYFSDPTHKTFFGLYTFDYLTKERFFRRKVPSYAQIINLKIESVSLNFISSKWLKIITIISNYIFNLNKYFLEFYEANFANIFPPYELKFVLKKV